VKRLAMETEPHPMDYNQFEGVIPEGEYGGGTVMIWDKGVWAPVAQDRLGDESDVDRQLKKGDLKFVLLGEKLLGSWVLVRTRGDRQWLLIKHKDEYASGDDLTVSKPLSIVSGRSMAEIGRAAGASPRQLQQAAGTDPAVPPPAVPARRGAGSGRRPESPLSPPRPAARRRAAGASRRPVRSSSRRAST
jgi:bifunctional non-homologous end joining protein LigD